jgi:hypothetical protein
VRADHNRLLARQRHDEAGVLDVVDVDYLDARMCGRNRVHDGPTVNGVRGETWHEPDVVRNRRRRFSSEDAHIDAAGPQRRDRVDDVGSDTASAPPVRREDDDPCVAQ